MAKSMIEEAERRGDLKPGMTIVEATGGSTDSSLAYICAIKGYRFWVVSSNAFAPEKLRTMSALGGEIELIHSLTGTITGDLIPSMARRAREIVESEDFYLTNQFSNRDADEGRQMCRRLAREEGLLVGTSTGLNVAAALALAKELGPGKKVVTVAVDTGLKYMNGTLFSE